MSYTAYLVGCIIFLSLHLQTHRAEAKNETWDDVWRGLKNSFELPVEDLWIKNNSTDEKAWGKFIRKWDADTVLSVAKDDNGNGYSPVINAGLKFKPLGYWFVESNFFHYLKTDEQDAWDPDFIYRFGYEDWRPYTLSFVYSNYAGNHSYGDLAEKYDKGTYKLSWKLPVPPDLAHPFLIETDRQVNCSVGFFYSPRYTSATGKLEHHKSRWSLTFNAPIYGRWYIISSAFYYPDSTQQQPWNPDYTYEFGYRNEDFSVSYKNYGGNRFPWRTHPPHDSSFANGSIGIRWFWN